MNLVYLKVITKSFKINYLELGVTLKKSMELISKGCYVGQENTARIKLKNKLNKRLFAIKVLEI